MMHNLELNLKTILLSALVLFAVPVLLSIAVVFLFGVVQLIATYNLAASSEEVSTVGHSTGFRLVAHTIHMVVAAVVGFRLAGELNVRAIPCIWAAVTLAVSVHFFMHALMGVGVVQLFTDIAFVELPVMMVVGAFVGLHASFWRRFGSLIKA